MCGVSGGAVAAGSCVVGRVVRIHGAVAQCERDSSSAYIQGVSEARENGRTRGSPTSGHQTRNLTHRAEHLVSRSQVMPRPVRSQ